MTEREKGMAGKDMAERGNGGEQARDAAPASGPSLRCRLENEGGRFTPSERRLAEHLLRNYPVAGLTSITALARDAGVSTPTVARLVHKLGFRGYPDFQDALRGDVQEMLASPLARHERWAAEAQESHPLNRMADAALANLQATLSRIDHQEFDAACDLVADRKRTVFALGGRITHAIADYLVTHLRIMRPAVRLVQEAAHNWPPALLDVRAGDVMVVFDIRRYENQVLEIASLAAEQGAEVILFTDQWVSPAADIARHRFSCHVDVPSAWDSSLTVLLLVETMIASVQERLGEEAADRMRALEQLYARTRFFRRRS